MKIKYLLLFAFLFSFLSLAQESEKALKVSKYLNTLKKYQKEKAHKSIKKLEDKDFKIIVKEVYEAEEIDPHGKNKIFEEDHNRWISEIKTDKNKLYKNVKYGVVEGTILNEIKKRYSNLIYILVRVPIFVKAHVISIKEDFDKDGFRKYVLKLKPEYIIKGKVDFINQPEFEVYYRNYEGVTPDKDFKVDKSYLLPIWEDRKSVV